MKSSHPFIKFLRWFPHQGFAFAACAVFIMGLLAGRAFMSVGMICLLGNALVNLKFKENFIQFTKNKSSLLLSALFLMFALTFFWSSNLPYFTSRMQIMLPFLVLPFAFQSIRWERKYFEYLFILFVGVAVSGASWSVWQYLIDMEGINASYGVSKSIPTPFNGDHIRFGVAVVMAVSVCFQFMKSAKKLQIVWALLALFLFIYLHLLASKTALLSLYFIIFYEIYLFIVRHKKWFWGLCFSVILLVMPVVFYYASPTFKNKIHYTQYAFYEMFNGKPQTNVSDEGRIVSYQTAWTVFKNNWFFGVGLGDGLDEMQAAYSQKNIETAKVLYPHNQFIYMALVLGSVGLFYFVFCCIYFFMQYFKTHDGVASFLLIFIVPFMVEAFLNTQYGIALFLFFFLLLQQYLQALKKEY